MRTVDLIIKKKNGGELTDAEIRYLISGYVSGEIPDYQMSSLLMAICFRDLNPTERFHLTKTMLESGERVDLIGLGDFCVDKHSTGGVGDKTTLALAPILAACGLKVAKMSGRGLGHTGGTIDKLESIPGFRTSLTQEEFFRQVRDISLAVAGQTAEIAIADKKLYALRDVTGTIESIGLIASSIMSKKLACGADYILLDVKVGAGAFMKDLRSARALAAAMVDIGRRFGKKTAAVLTNMDEPLGEAVGNALEVIEAIETLKGRGPEDFRQLCRCLVAELLVMTGKAHKRKAALTAVDKAIASGAALKKFREMIIYQGGDPAVIDDYALLPQARYRHTVTSPESGYVAGIDALAIGRAAMALGAGRNTKEEAINLAVGITVKAKTGRKVERGMPLAVIYADRDDFSDVAAAVQSAFTIAPEQTKEKKLILGTVY